MSTILDIALSQYGVKEIPGREHNPVILNYFEEIGHRWVKSDETAWCSAFANWVALKGGYQRSDKLNARSWLTTGITVQQPLPGDIVVFWREHPSSWKGHVSFFVNYDHNKSHLYCLGGNQDDMVCIKPYPVYKLLGFRRPLKIG